MSSNRGGDKDFGGSADIAFMMAVTKIVVVMIVVPERVVAELAV